MATGAWAQEMVEVPGGRFKMGDGAGVGEADERPAHMVEVSTFRMDRFEVSNAEFARVMQWALEEGLVVAGEAGVSNVEGQVQELLDVDDWNCEVDWVEGRLQAQAGREEFPCMEVTWYGAMAYANFRSLLEGLEPCVDFTQWGCDFSANGYRLPTEAEWEKAARGGLVGQQFPWRSAHTNGEDVTGAMANFWGSGDAFEGDETIQTTPVGYYNGSQQPAGADMANGYGLYDMAGNVWEWCWDFYDPDWYGRADGPASQRSALQGRGAGAIERDPTGPALGYGRVVRGGSWLSGSKDAEDAEGFPAGGLRCANRVVCDPASGRHNRGFRCVRRAL